MFCKPNVNQWHRKSNITSAEFCWFWISSHSCCEEPLSAAEFIPLSRAKLCFLTSDSRFCTNAQLAHECVTANFFSFLPRVFIWHNLACCLKKLPMIVLIEKGERYHPQLFLYTTSRPLALSKQTQSARNAQWLTRRLSIEGGITR